MIPKKIHTCWFSKDPDLILSKKIKSCIESWKKYCPDYEIKIWTIKDWPEFEEFSYAKQCWEAGIASYAYLSNFFRFWVLYNHGGFYLESDMMLKGSLDDFLEDTVVLGEINPGEISGALMGSEKDHPLFKHMINVYKKMNWINPDNSLNLYHDSGLNGVEIRRAGYQFPKNINSKFTIKDVSIYPKNCFFPEYLEDGIYSFHMGSLTHYKKISIVMPVWNSEKYLKEAIDSVLDQDFEDFELLCIDDGSEDSSKAIIESYIDDRVVYIGKKHSGIVDSLNIGFRRAIGEFIVRFDSDDIMLPQRLSHQYSYMKEHPEIDILSSGFQWGNMKLPIEYWMPKERTLEFKDFQWGNVMSHPTTIFNSSKIKKLPYLYENYFAGVEDYKLWHHALSHGLVLGVEPTPVIIYRQHEGQVTKQSSYSTESSQLVNRVRRMYYKFKEEYITGKRLSCIIPFQNEGSEVERTVTSIRGTVGNNVNIILINDNSNDGFDYKGISERFDCQYYENPKNYGVAGSRNFGVSVCDTEYFVLLDAHMRFYEDDWHMNLIKALDENPGSLVSSQTIVFTYDNSTKLYNNEEGKTGRNNFGTYGAIVNFDEPGWEFTAKWTNRYKPQEITNNNILEIPCCLGAVYATSKELWHKLGGLNGLIKYGLDEPLISLKVWLSGGKVLLMNDWGVGHLYRGRSPYNVQLNFLDQNQIYLIHLFSRTEQEIIKYEINLQNRFGIERFQEAKKTFMNNYKDFKEFKNYFMEKVAIRDLDWFINYINNPSK